MQNITVITLGTLKEKYLKEAVLEYSKRLKTLCKFEIIELSEHKIPDNPSQKQIEISLEKEAEKIFSKINKSSVIIALCIEGKQKSSEELARYFEECAINSKSHITFIIGSSFGLSDMVKEAAHLKLSFSKMTFPHQLARVLLCEQIYRAFKINQNSEYHK